ncbi:MAG TPA: tetratricopeptide repeat protein [Tepidisphaeraceae bacterium]|nr:tetratricopeptide repeat protein [Tepidisphaeraceae bacterium]
MRHTTLLLATLGLGTFIAPAAARADDFVREAIPGKWINPLVPEDLEKLEYPAYFKDFDKAKMESETGRYKLSLLTLAKVKPGDADPARVAHVKATSLAAIGRKQQALDALSAGPAADDAACLVLRARILSDLTRYDEAVTTLEKVRAKDKESVAAHYYLGEINERRGDMDAAKKAYGFFEAWVDKLHAQELDSAEALTLIGRGIDRWATMNMVYKDKVGLHQQLLDKTFTAATRVDREYWPARAAAAEFYIARDDQKKAGGLLKAVLEQNPNDVRSLYTIGLLAVDGFNFDGAEKAIDMIRKVDPDSVEGDVLETRNLLQQRRPKDAHRVISRVVARQPKNVEAMGLLAAVYALQLKEQEMNDVLKRVEQLDPDNATAYFEVAEQLGSMRQYPRSAAKYQVAIERAPWWTHAMNGLGLLYTQWGEEDKAYETLEKARLFDPFNFATTNYLKLLDDFRGYAKKETAHFILYYDAKIDPVIPEYFTDYLESIYKDVTGNFKHEPAAKTLIEIFPTHDAFSVRTTGSPWIGTVGASTGRVIAMVSPRKGKNTMGTYNWAQVLRHEFTHTVTLSATDNRIAHWMTEGLAVVEERTPLRWEWVPMLYNAVSKKQLFTMENLTWGFVRPKKPSDRQLAYAQSYWICQYIEDTFGHDKLLAMLAEFRKGEEQQDVFPRILGKSLSQFQKDFFDWTDKQVSTWGYDAATSAKYKKLATDGEALIKARKYPEALKVFQQIVEIRPMDALPHQRLAGLYLTKEVNQPAKAVEHLVRLHKVELHDNRWAKRIARLYRDTKTFDKAVEYGVQAVYIDPYDVDAHELLADLYDKAGNSAGAARERNTLKILDDYAKSGTKEGDRATNPG